MTVKTTAAELYVEGFQLKDIDTTLKEVIEAMQEKGYNPVNQLIGYLLSGEPTYITAHNQARIKIQKIDRDILLQVMVENYISSFPELTK